MPTISVIVPVFNGASYLAECLDSLLAQTADDFEVVCIDDESTDETPAILAEFALRDGRLGWFSQKRGGLSASCSRGIDLSSGQCLLVCAFGNQLRPDGIPSLVESVRGRLKGKTNPTDGRESAIARPKNAKSRLDDLFRKNRLLERRTNQLTNKLSAVRAKNQRILDQNRRLRDRNRKLERSLALRMARIPMRILSILRPRCP